MFQSKRLLSNDGRRFVIPILALCLILFLIISTYQRVNSEHKTNLRNINSFQYAPTIFEDVFYSKVKPKPGRTFFFLETKCKWKQSETESYAQYINLNFTAHQVCSIESAALHNPSFEVFVLYACPTYYSEPSSIIEALLSYKNVKFRNINLWRYVKNTSIENFLKTDALFKSRFLMYNVSDLLRILTLYHFGGIYLDMDIMLLRSFEDEPLNFVGAESDISVGNSVIALESDGFGHNVGEQFLRDYQNNFNGDLWAYNGPKSLVRVMNSVCGTNGTELTQVDRVRCKGFKIFNRSAFYEIKWQEWIYFFDPTFANRTLERVKDSHAIHLWNHLNTKWPLSVESKAAYIQLAAKHCPRVFKATGAFFN